jgi:hypothetical protein
MESLPLATKKGLNLLCLDPIFQRTCLVFLFTFEGDCSGILLQKYLAILGALVWTLFLNLMSWLGGGRVFFPESDFTKDQYFPVLFLNELVASLFAHFLQEEMQIALSLSELRRGIII